MDLKVKIGVYNYLKVSNIELRENLFSIVLYNS